jgi:hypothetical protein
MFFYNQCSKHFHSDKYLVTCAEDVPRNACRSSEEVSVIVSSFNQNWNVLTNFSKIPQYRTSYKSVHWFSSRYMWTDSAKLMGTEILLQTYLKISQYLL